MSENIQTTGEGQTINPVTIQDVARARAEHLRINSEQMDALKKAHETPEYKAYNALDEANSLAYKAVKELEDAYRAQCVAAYQSTGEKQQLGGVVKLYKSLIYDTGLAVEWSLKHGHAQLLKLNATAFEKVAKELALEFVEASEEPRMTLASDLSEYLEGE